MAECQFEVGGFVGRKIESARKLERGLERMAGGSGMISMAMSLGLT
jgi:hypothetical protein